MKKRSEVGVDARVPATFTGVDLAFSERDTGVQQALAQAPAIEQPAEPTPPKLEFRRSGRMRVVWGEEKFTVVPGSYSTVTVGPIELECEARPDKTLAEQYEEMFESLRLIAEEERERKIASFVAKLQQATGRAR
jgi:hypothetical protein